MEYKINYSLKISALYLEKELRKSGKLENLGIDLAPQIADRWVTSLLKNEMYFANFKTILIFYFVGILLKLGEGVIYIEDTVKGG